LGDEKERSDGAQGIPSRYPVREDGQGEIGVGPALENAKIPEPSDTSEIPRLEAGHRRDKGGEKKEGGEPFRLKGQILEKAILKEEGTSWLNSALKQHLQRKSKI